VAVEMPDGSIVVIFQGNDLERGICYTPWYMVYDEGVWSEPALLLPGEWLAAFSAALSQGLGKFYVTAQNWIDDTYGNDIFLFSVGGDSISQFQVCSGSVIYLENTPPSGNGYTITKVDPPTGYAFDHWIVDGTTLPSGASFTVDAPYTVTACYKMASTISILSSPAMIIYGETTTISGSIDPPHSSVPVILSYSTDGGSTWVSFMVVYTDSSGSYSTSWRPPSTLTYSLRASWSGDVDHSGATSGVESLAVGGSVPPRPSLLITLWDSTYSKGETATIEITVFNPTSTTLDATLYISIIGPGGYCHFDSVGITVAAESFGSSIFDWNIPAGVQTGTYQIIAGLIPPVLTAYDMKYVEIS